MKILSFNIWNEGSCDRGPLKVPYHLDRIALAILEAVHSEGGGGLAIVGLVEVGSVLVESRGSRGQSLWSLVEVRQHRQLKNLFLDHVKDLSA